MFCDRTEPEETAQKTTKNKQKNKKKTAQRGATDK